MFCQLPFTLGYHPGPNDFWRFTKEGMRELFSRNPWVIEEVDLTLGHGSGFYRIAVEYVAVNASFLGHRAYLVTKGVAAVFLYPLKIPDFWSNICPQKDRIPGGYYCIARKPGLR